MIAFVRGEVAAVTLSSAVLEVGGVGLELMCTPGTLATLRVGRPATLPTSMVVREDSLTIFGFLDDDEKSIFEIVQTASGVGPKVAQAIVAVMSPDDVRRAITTEDVKALTRVPGIGQKGAQRIILELKDRIGPPVGVHHPASAAVPATEAWRDQVQQGLVGLGWSAKESEKAVEAVAPDAGDAPDVGALLRAALRALSKA
ncbi:Holliday junction branch migration protein RuvA [Nocardioides cavernae]|uniref:Holliday junction branch migration complex subunit RuvA n=1 Tax=Nocardioides cavernae TaxID=1921566 RepID=A0ABR8NGD0_9ACTN|nr:Holliday junction branch migration protein RuvA [Nocardioides cavernae]MBD3927178.1 Holliday junction branch migration protein RuvA [Nocardioides cavernae]MBM7512899.1 Holliday junction DNA helicase RuvA [Nocardioides cavernae]